MTRKLARKHNRPCLHINLDKTPVFLAASEIYSWILKKGIEVLNVAGSRASKDPEISKDTRYIVEGLLLLSVVKAQVGAHITDYNNDEYLSKLPVSPKTVDEAVDRMISDLDLRAKILIANIDLHQLFDQHLLIVFEFH